MRRDRTRRRAGRAVEVPIVDPTHGGGVNARVGRGGVFLLHLRLGPWMAPCEMRAPAIRGRDGKPEGKQGPFVAGGSNDQRNPREASGFEQLPRFVRQDESIDEWPEVDAAVGEHEVRFGRRALEKIRGRKRTERRDVLAEPKSDGLARLAAVPALTERSERRVTESSALRDRAGEEPLRHGSNHEVEH